MKKPCNAVMAFLGILQPTQHFLGCLAADMVTTNVDQEKHKEVKEDKLVKKMNYAYSSMNDIATY